MQLSDFEGLPIIGNPEMVDARGQPSKEVHRVTGPDGLMLMCHPEQIAPLEAAIERERQRAAGPKQ